MSVEFNSDMNYVYQFRRSSPQTDSVTILGGNSSTFKRTISDIVMSIYAPNPAFFAINKHPKLGLKIDFRVKN